jgi:flagellar hook assembly protein FlgD
VTIEVYDVSGRLVATLVDGFEPEGERTVTWDGLNSNGEQMATGVYFYRMNADGIESSKKMLLLK